MMISIFLNKNHKKKTYTSLKNTSNEIQLLTIFAKRETVVFDTTFANGLYTTVDFPSGLELLSDELQTAAPQISAWKFCKTIRSEKHNKVKTREHLKDYEYT